MTEVQVHDEGGCEDVQEPNVSSRMSVPRVPSCQGSISREGFCQKPIRRHRLYRVISLVGEGLSVTRRRVVII